MLNSVISDLLAIPDCHVITCVREQLLPLLPVLHRSNRETNLQITLNSSPKMERHYFEKSCKQADVVWIIAPEFDDILYSRTVRALQSGARVIGPDLNTIQLTTDKWRLFEFLNEHSLPTIPTSPLDEVKLTTPVCVPCVVKHRFGAGGLGIHYIEHLPDCHKRLLQIPEDCSDYIMQPFISGRMLSTVVLIKPGRKEIFPLGEQHLCWVPGFRYQGGSIPVDLNEEVKISIQCLLRRVCDLLPGLAGYIGFDLLLPDMTPTEPLIVEINPRLTTSYTGYRQLTQDNLAERIVDSGSTFSLIKWKMGQEVQFQSDGSVTLKTDSHRENSNSCM